jgi:hypothetical protein
MEFALDNYKQSCEVRVSSRKLTLLKPLPLFFLSWRGCLAYISPPPFQVEMPPKPQCSNPYKRVIPPTTHDRHPLHNYGCPSTDRRAPGKGSREEELHGAGD